MRPAAVGVGALFRRPAFIPWQPDSASLDSVGTSLSDIPEVQNPGLPGCWPGFSIQPIINRVSPPWGEPAPSFQPFGYLLPCLCENQAALLPPHQVGAPQAF